ncbi:uncharacterized protein VTP21DRAFT_127 [Calcarisporiella thermophila]|uniref:uncharacterized protein n=1 Tax=Calcarisporiella thermophila TaxID=911321 RepID=UPI0037420A6F
MVGLTTLTSAAGVISLLDEEEKDLKIFALEQLNKVVDQFWAEISDSVSKIEVLYEDKHFSHRELAALVASKVYYHLEAFDESLSFALGAGKLFDLSLKTEYVETIISKCIDKYIALRIQQYEDPNSGATIDPRLQQVVERMFQRCLDDGEYNQAIGIALESRRLDIVERTVLQGNARELLQYVLDISMTLVQNLDFRNKVLRLLVNLYSNLSVPDYISISQCLVHLNDSSTCAQMLQDLVNKGDDSSLLMAYQVAFDLEENARQDFLQKISNELPKPEPAPEPAPSAPATAETSNQEAMETEEATSERKEPETSKSPFDKIRSILSGEESIKLHLEFLYRNNHSDLLILKNTKGALDSRNSAYHSALTFANAFMHSGTTSDEFLRQNLEWLSRATNWSKFSATAALGVIHKGQLSQGLSLLQPYLPQDGVSGSPYSEGGALYALGLINANHGHGVLNYLLTALRNTQTEVVQHGACLGLGVAGMATENEEIYEELKTVLFGDSAIAGEAAGYSMGLVMIGSASTKAIDEMLQYAHETQHEKIIRGLAMGMALVMYGREEQADTLIEQLCRDKDPILRYGGIYTVAMAYAGTGNNKAIRRLLHVAVSDVNDDVRRAAVTSLGFILFRVPNQVPRIVQLLAESYNPHVRYGATLALGIACAGTGLVDAIELLEPMTKDTTDFVRQGALIALAMVLIQQTEATNPKVASVRKLYEKIISDKHEDPMAKFGAVLSQGVIDAGGRNVTISLQSRLGHANMSAIVGMTIFTQFWYWYPLMHFLSLAFTPTAIIGLNKDLKVPKFEIVSNVRPSLFAYPAPTKPPTANVVEKVATAVLSTTVKTRARAKRSEKEKEKAEAEPMETDEKKETSEKADTKAEDSQENQAEDSGKSSSTDKKGKNKKAKEEPTSETLPNMARVVPAQLKYIVFPEDARYVPVKQTSNLGGILMMLDRKPGEAEDLIQPSAPTATAPSAVQEEEAPPPEPFEYPFDD